MHKKKQQFNKQQFISFSYKMVCPIVVIVVAVLFCVLFFWCHNSIPRAHSEIPDPSIFMFQSNGQHLFLCVSRRDRKYFRICIHIISISTTQTTYIQLHHWSVNAAINNTQRNECSYAPLVTKQAVHHQISGKLFRLQTSSQVTACAYLVEGGLLGKISIPAVTKRERSQINICLM